MMWRRKSSNLSNAWEDFSAKFSGPQNQTGVSPESAGASRRRDHQETLSQAMKPAAQRLFASLHNYLIMKTPKEAPGIILVCSATSGEGATSVALGLAVAAARDKQDNILLIDGNFYQPSLSQAWGLPTQTGFFELLTGATQDRELAQRTKLGNLWVLGAGSTMESEARDVEPEHLQEILASLERQFTAVIVDGPALNAHPESNLFALYAKHVLLVIAAGISRAPVVQNAIAKLPFQVREKLEVVLNRRIYPIPEVIYKKLWTS